MLERLEATDRPAELDAVLGVGDGEVEATARRTDLFHRQQDCRGVGQPGIGAEVDGGAWFEAGEPPGGIHRRRRVCGELGPAGQLAVRGGDDDVGDVAVDDVVGIEHHRPDGATLGELLQRVPIGFVGGQQRNLRQGVAEQRGRDQALAELLDHHGRVGQFATRAAEFFRNHQRRDADLLAQQRPQLLVVPALRLHRAPHGLRVGVLLDERRDGLAE